MPPPLIAFTDSPPVAGNDPLVARYLQDMPLLNLFREKELPAQSERFADQLERTPEGRRAVQPFYLLGRQMKSSEYPVDVVAIFERGAIDTTQDTGNMANLAWRLQRRGIELDMIYVDNELDLTPWTQGLERLRDVYRSDAAKARMPEALRAFDLEKLKFMTPEYHDWMLHLNWYTQKIRIDAIRKSLIDSGLASPWGQRTTMVNFFTMRTSFRVYDFNGWEVDQRELLDDRTSCPVAYPSQIGQRYDPQISKRVHHPVWNSFIDCLNHSRSSAATSAILPVIREPLRAKGLAKDTVDPGARWLMDHLIGHLVRTGATQFMMFHYHTNAAEELALAQIMEKHEDAALPSTTRTTFPEIQMDVDEVVTGDFKTTYSEFLKQEPDRWAKPS